MKRTTIAVFLLILAAFGVAGIIFFSQLTTPKKYSGAPANITIGSSVIDVSGLIWLAADQGYFLENGLNVTTRIFEAGKYAVSALLDSEVDVAAASEFVFVGNAMKKEKIQTVGSIAKGEFHYLVAQKDRGIRQLSDLKGKRIGLSMQTSAEFYLGRYLQLHGINLHDITVIDLNPSQASEFLATGQVDAVLLWDPYAYPLEKNLGDNAVVWPVQSGQMMYWLLIARRDYITGHPEVVDRLLLSLHQAEHFAIDNPDKAKKILQTRLKLDDAYVERVWPKIRLSLSLDQGLIIAMEDESRWMMGNNPVSNRKIPYYPDHISWRGLKKVSPESVTVIH